MFGPSLKPRFNFTVDYRLSKGLYGLSIIDYIETVTDGYFGTGYKLDYKRI
jgi:hypothetical protein